MVREHGVGVRRWTRRDLIAEQLNETINVNNMVLVAFWASWYGPDRLFVPTFHASSNKHSDVVHLNVDTKAERQLALAAQIRSIPTLVAFKKGKPLLSQAGDLTPAVPGYLVQQIKAFDVSDDGVVPDEQV